MGIYSEVLMTKTFKGEVSKKAYLDACKWLAQNVYSKPDISKYVNVKFEKKKNKKQESIFKVTLFVSVDEKEIAESYCSKCKSLYTLLYAIDKPKCEECKLKAFRTNLLQQLDNLHEFCQEVIEDED